MSSGKRLTSASGKRVDKSAGGGKQGVNGAPAGSANGKKGKKKSYKGPIVFWSVLLFIAVVFAFCKLTIRPPEITPVPHTSVAPAENTTKPVESVDEEAKIDLGVSDDPMRERKKDFYTFLIVGMDKVGSNTDVMMVASFDTDNHEVNVVNIPRDTLVDVKRHVKKINAAYGVGGMDNLMKEVSSLIGFKPDRYMLVDLKAFVSLVDCIDGVDFDVPINMSYEDPTQDLSIHFKKGMQHLDGQSALEVVRFRHNNNGTGYMRQDLDRIQTTQHLLSTVAKKMIRPSTLLRINDLAKIAEDNLDTDLKFGELAWLGTESLSVDSSEGIHFNTLSEKSTMYQGLSYVYVEKQKALALINSTINPYTTDITDLDIITP